MTPRPGLPAPLLRQFDYLRHPVHAAVVAGHESEPAPAQVQVQVQEVDLRAPGQDPVRAYLVVPGGPATATRHPAVLWLHWEGHEHADHTHFLAEAIDLAAEYGLVSLLPRMAFPFVQRPVGDPRDRDAVIKQVIQLRRALDYLLARDDVDHATVTLVGHDYGGMYGALLAAVEPARLSRAVLVAIDATWGNWFVSYFLRLPEEDVVPFTTLFDTLEPTRYLPYLPRGGLMFQFADDDAYLTEDAVTAAVAVAPSGTVARRYPTDHGMDLPAVRSDRRTFLAS